MRSRFSALVLALAAAAGLLAGCKEPSKPRLLLISLDGFRWDYRERFATPTLDGLASSGASAEKFQPAFPSKTFPNHFTLVTGLLPDHHGIVSNTMRDPKIPGVLFSMSNRDAVVDPRWWQAEPIWTTLENAGRRTAPWLWPGSEAPVGGVKVTHAMVYKQDLTDAERIALVTDLFAKPEAEWPDFTTLYWPDVDTAGHASGPDSAEVKAAVERIDSALGQLRSKLQELGAAEGLHVIVVSDHGMSAQSPDRVIYLEDYIDLASVETIDSSPNIGIFPRQLTADQAYQQLAGRHPHLQVYRKHEIPARLQFGSHPRIPPIYLMADDGWTMLPRRQAGRRFSLGAHGYDNALDSMQGLLVAGGPAFRAGVRVDRFRAIDLYELMCRILGVDPEKNDGRAAAAGALLK